MMMRRCSILLSLAVLVLVGSCHGILAFVVPPIAQRHHSGSLFVAPVITAPSKPTDDESADTVASTTTTTTTDPPHPVALIRQELEIQVEEAAAASPSSSSSRTTSTTTTTSTPTTTNECNQRLQQWAQKGHVEKATALLEQMMASESLDGRPNLLSFHAVLQAYISLLELPTLPTPAVPPSQTTTTSSSVSNTYRHVDQLLRAIQSNDDLRPTPETFALSMQAVWGAAATTATQRGSSSQSVRSQNRKEGLSRVETLYQRALAVLSSQDDNLPQTSLHLALLNAYADYADEASLQKARDLVAQLESENKANRVVYNTLMKAWKNYGSSQLGNRSASSPKQQQKQQKAALQQLEVLLSQLEATETADTLSYTTYLSALASQGTPAAAQKALQILRDMETRSSEDDKPHLQPNTWTYNCVLHGFALARDPVRAEQLLREMEESATVTPTVSSYTSVMNGWSKSGRKEYLSRMFSLKERLEARYKAGDSECRPNQFVYATLIHACAKARTPEAADRAESILKSMYETYQEESGDSSHAKPNIQLVTSVIDAHSRSQARDAGERAQALLAWTLRIHQETRDADLRPNAHTFSATINAWARSRQYGKAERARELLVLMNQLYKKGQLPSGPNIYCFTNVINCCAYCEKEEMEMKSALRIAVQTYKDLLSKANDAKTADTESSPSLRPTHVTFATFLTALRNLLPGGPARTNAVRSVFETAAKHGQVDSTVLHKLQAVLSPDDLSEILPADCWKKGQIYPEFVPESWSRNVVA